ncbi:uncharacterized protein LOC109539341 isoform X2 [Dendroctonus ponderosae]|uniref:CCZ1/INTU/HSP4 first Longin domain-containing protein n=1 Tax=Dendroctonus ponderosae TaxID=77166 RepID=A0AAR5PP60_DENPD|nr:uncharacterized protein LOC109539341 isoform X2 [Dendroctonus ponderosae]KAH1002771.1 hypothetical protein HUJ04_008827 [Dendroctonus ponderosae]
MAKETTIIFLYDTELLKREEDDPNSAILYFHPGWVSDHQKTALCGQLMGTVLCLRSILAMPKILALQTGKFCLIENGRFILVVGTDKNIPDWVLQRRANVVYSMVNFFHKDFMALAQRYEAEKLKAKLYHIFDTYLKLLYLGGNIFHNIPSLDLPQTEADLLANVRRFLSKLRTIQHTLGGTLLYHNKIVLTQLSNQVTKQITFSDPFHIKNPAEISHAFHELPPGVKLLEVYISTEDFNGLSGTQTASEQACKESHCNENKTIKEFDATSAPKRDTSLLFTSVPEDAPFSPNKQVHLRSQKKRSRPNSLNLKSYCLDASNESQLSSSTTPYWSHSSAVSTPMSESKTFAVASDLNKNRQQLWKMCMDFHSTYIDENVNSTRVKKYYEDKQFENAKALLKCIQRAVEGSSLFHAASLSRLPELNSIYSDQYISHTSIKRSKSIHDPLFPWFKRDQLAASQYYIEDILDKNLGIFRTNGTSVQRLFSERKKSLSLPIKPFNASEPQKSSLNSPGGYCTPLMNRLSMPNPFERQLSSDISIAPFFNSDKRDDANVQLKKCILFMHEERDVVMAMLLTQECLKDKGILEKLHCICGENLPALGEQLCAALQPPKTGLSANPCSILSLDAEWDTRKQCGLWEGLDLGDLTKLHGDFQENADLTDIYLRRPESVLLGQRNGTSEVFYRESASATKGLLQPNDALRTLHESAKTQLAKNHDIFIR